MKKTKANIFQCAYRFVALMAYTAKRTAQVNRASRRAGMTAPGVNLYTQVWGQDMVKYLHVNVHLSGPEIPPEPAIFVGNHVSYIDIPVLVSITPMVFVAKHEISKWPLFGDACRSVGTVFVDRNMGNSRKEAGLAITRTIQDRGVNVALFPSGTTCLDESKPWRRGPFQIARVHGLPLQPFRISYRPERKTAFIDDDSLAPHIWGVLREGSVDCHIEFGERLQPGPADELTKQVWEWTKQRKRPGLAT